VDTVDGGHLLAQRGWQVEGRAFPFAGQVLRACGDTCPASPQWIPMNASLQLGPLVMPYGLLLIVAAIALGLYLGKRAGRVVGVDPEPQAFRVLMVAVVVARLAFVWQYKDAYLESPWGILDIRDGGWDAQVGVVAAGLYTLTVVRRQAALRKPLLTTVAWATALWFVGSIGLLVLRDDVRLPKLALQAMDGAPTSLASFEGKPTVVNLWATWCPPCVREMPVLQRAQTEHPEINFVFLNQGESPEKVQLFLARYNLNLRNVLLDRKGQAGAQFNQAALPTTLFFDGSGRLVDQRVGELSQATMAQRLGALVVGSSQPAVAHPVRP
jgi:thiol-disulfide isomerase/thioredoxin